jgi:YbbR domain-containing protein
MNKSLRWLRESVTENIGWKLLSLLIAVVLWIVVASEPELSTFATVRLEYRNLPEELEIASEPVGTISLELRGPSGELGANGESVHPAVILDMSGTQPGERTFSIGDGSTRLPRGVRLVRAIPSQVRFDFEKRAIRAVNPVPRFTGEGQSGYVIAGWTVDPPQLHILGPAGHVARITTVVTDPIDVSNVVGSSEFRVNAFVTDAFVRFQESPQVMVTVTMKRK